jgi:hypothetical protein
MRYLIVDGMLSGTGVRDAVDGGYIELVKLDVSVQLKDEIANWLARYEAAHYTQFSDIQEVDALDTIGRKLCNRLAHELSESKTEYFSAAQMKKLDC